MAEEKEEKKEKSEGSGKSGLLLILIIIIQLVLAAAVVVFVIYPKYQEMVGNAPVESKKTAKKEQKEKSDDEEGEQKGIGPTFTISDLTVNPKGSMGRRFAVFEVVLEVNDPTVIEKLNQSKPIIVDKYLSYLRSKTVAELSSQEEIKKIREEMKTIINELLGEDVVENLYFTRFVLE